MELTLTIQPDFQRKETQIFAIYHISKASDIINHNRIVLKCRHQDIIQIFINQSKIPNRAIISYNPICRKSDDQHYQSVFQMQDCIYTENKVRNEQGDIIIDLSQLESNGITTTINSISFLIRIKNSPTLQYRNSSTIKSVYESEKMSSILWINPFNSDASNYIPVPIQGLNSQLTVNTQFMVNENMLCIAGGQQVSRTCFIGFSGRLVDYFMQVGEYVRAGDVIFCPFLRLFNFELVNKIVEEASLHIQKHIVGYNTEICQKIKQISIIVNNNVMETAYKKQFMIIPHLQLQRYADLDYKGILGLTTRIIHEFSVCVALTCCTITCDDDDYYALILGHLIKELCYNRFISQIDAYYLQFQACHGYQQLLNMKVPVRAGKTIAGRGSFSTESELRAAVTALFLFKNRPPEDLYALITACFNSTSQGTMTSLQQFVSGFETAENDTQMKGNGSMINKFDKFDQKANNYDSYKYNQSAREHETNSLTQLRYRSSGNMYNRGNSDFNETTENTTAFRTNDNPDKASQTFSVFDVVQYIATARYGILFELVSGQENSQQIVFPCARDLNEIERNLLNKAVMTDRISGVKARVQNSNQEHSKSSYSSYNMQNTNSFTQKHTQSGRYELEGDRGLQVRPDTDMKLPFILFSWNHQKQSDDSKIATAWYLGSTDKDQFVKTLDTPITAIKSLVRQNNQETMNLLAELQVQLSFYSLFQAAITQKDEFNKAISDETLIQFLDESEQVHISAGSAKQRQVNRIDISKRWRRDQISIVQQVLSGKQVNLTEIKEEILLDAAFYISLSHVNIHARNYGIKLQEVSRSYFFSDRLFLGGLQVEVWSLFQKPSEQQGYVVQYKETLKKLLDIVHQPLTAQNIRLSALGFIGALIDYALVYVQRVDDKIEAVQLEILAEVLGISWDAELETRQVENNNMRKNQIIISGARVQNLVQGKLDIARGIHDIEQPAVKVQGQRQMDKAIDMQQMIRGVYLLLCLDCWRMNEESGRDYDALLWARQLETWAGHNHQLDFDQNKNIDTFLDLQYVYNVTLPVSLQSWCPNYLKMAATQVVDVMIRNFHPGFQRYCDTYGHENFAWSCFGYCGGSSHKYHSSIKVNHKTKFDINNPETQMAISRLIDLYQNAIDVTLQASYCAILGTIDKGNLHTDAFWKEKAANKLDKQVSRFKGRQDENTEKGLLEKRIYQGITGVITYLDEKQEHMTCEYKNSNEDQSKNVVDCLFQFGIAALI